jgi:hypothetical protein
MSFGRDEIIDYYDQNYLADWWESPHTFKSLEVHMSQFGARSRFVNSSYSRVLCKSIYGGSSTAEFREKCEKVRIALKANQQDPSMRSSPRIDLDVSNLQAYISSSPESLS